MLSKLKELKNYYLKVFLPITTIIFYRVQKSEKNRGKMKRKEVKNQDVNHKEFV